MLFDYSHRHEVYYGGGGSGKSVFITQKLLIKALNDKRRVLVMRKVGKSCRQSTWELMLDTLSKFHIKDKCRINKSNYEIELPNGSLFIFTGCDDVEKIKSIFDITDIWCEECTEFSVDDVEQLDIRLRAAAPNLQIFYSFNPVSKANWVFKRWFIEGVVIPDNTCILKTTYKDNQFLPQAYIDALEAKINTNPTYYKIYALGEFCSLDKLVYNNWEIGEIPDTTKFDLLLGCDFGFTNDMTAFIVSFRDEANKTIYIKDEYCKTGMVNNDIAEMIKYKGFAKSLIIFDSAEPKSVEELRRSGIIRAKAAVKGKDSINQGISKLQEYKIIVSPTCTNTITELENYSWQKDKQSGEYINKPIDDFNHCLDALRYSLQCVDNTHKLQTISKSSLGI